MAVESFGTEREDIGGDRFKKLKLKKDEEVRVGIIFFDEAGKKMFLGTKVHVKEGMKTFLCKSTKDSKEVCCTHSWSGNDPKFHIGCVVIVYNLGKEDGKIKLKSYELLPWIFWDTMYNRLVSYDNELPLTTHDIKIKCTQDDPYVKYDLNPCNNSIWVNSPNLKEKILTEAKPIFEGISKNLGAELSVSEIKELLGIDVTGSDDAATDVDLGSVVESLA